MLLKLCFFVSCDPLFCTEHLESGILIMRAVVMGISGMYLGFSLIPI
jgi:hypothetical protein